MNVHGGTFKVRLQAVVIVFLLVIVFGGGVAWAATKHDGQLWVPLYNRFELGETYRGWFEVNPRFGDTISEIDQLLIRPAIGYQIAPSLSLWQGYAWITNYQPRFRDEHRLYQEVSYRRNFSYGGILSRTRLEERFVQDAGGVAIRAREMLRADVPLGDGRMWGFVIYDELFVNLNTVRRGPEAGFDQNRLFVGVHRKVNKDLSFDFGYQNQTINTSGPNFADRMNHILLMQWFIDWRNPYDK